MIQSSLGVSRYRLGSIKKEDRGLLFLSIELRLNYLRQICHHEGLFSSAPVRLPVVKI